MEEEILKIYDNLYNVIGVAPRSEVHKKGLLQTLPESDFIHHAFFRRFDSYISCDVSASSE